jgi:hypothetical protein
MAIAFLLMIRECLAHNLITAGPVNLYPATQVLAKVALGCPKEKERWRRRERIPLTFLAPSIDGSCRESKLVFLPKLKVLFSINVYPVQRCALPAVAVLQGRLAAPSELS